MRPISKKMMAHLIMRKQDVGIIESIPNVEVWDADPNRLGRIIRFIHSRHTLGLELIGALVLALFFLAIFVFTISFHDQVIKLLKDIADTNGIEKINKLITLLLSPLLFYAVLQFLYSTGSKRRGAVALVLNEIVGIARVIGLYTNHPASSRSALMVSAATRTS